MSKRIEMIGKRFKRLTVLREAGKEKWGDMTFMCICDCGNQVRVHGKNLRRGTSKSCGCLRVEMSKTVNKSHGMYGTPFLGVYRAIRNRCENTKTISYPNYGGRGIKCLWRTFEDFKYDMYESYLEHTLTHGGDTSIERVENDGNYCRENCRWATAKEQAANRRGTFKTGSRSHTSVRTSSGDASC